MTLQNWKEYTYHPPLLDTYKLGFKFGVKYPLSFGSLSGSPHLGVDYILPTGKPIYAIADGTTKSSTGVHAGNIVTLVTNRGLSVRYMHLSRFVKESNGRVSRGQIIGYTGNTGTSTAPHLHMDVFKGLVTNINQFYNFIDPLSLNYSTTMPEPEKPQPQNPEDAELAKEFNYQGKDFETRICENYEILQAYPVLFLAHKYGYVDGNHDWNGKNIRRFVKWWAQYRSVQAFKIAVERDYQAWLQTQSK
jgi:murein DD-endopeptidase MepM/ murein hydrolase activator NlpD